MMHRCEIAGNKVPTPDTSSATRPTFAEVMDDRSEETLFLKVALKVMASDHTIGHLCGSKTRLVIEVSVVVVNLISVVVLFLVIILL